MTFKIIKIFIESFFDFEYLMSENPWFEFSDLEREEWIFYVLELRLIYGTGFKFLKLYTF